MDLRREARLAFNMKSDEDGDDDGLPDGWEDENGLDPANGGGDRGLGGDPDGDGLTNEEEFEMGTRPMDPDSDNGGENDSSKVSGGRDPNDPLDDEIKPPTSLRAIPEVGYVNLTIGYLPEHDYIVLYRSTDADGPWDRVEVNLPVSSYMDDGLENGVTYYYKATGLIVRDRPYESIPTRTVSATPKGDPIPPSGYMIINGGAQSTTSQSVSLKIWADPDTEERCSPTTQT